MRDQLIFGWGMTFLGSLMGLLSSAQWDFPTGASVVTSFGGLLILLALVRSFLRT